MPTGNETAAPGPAGRFALSDKLGEGAFAQVWAARDPDSGERAAIKILVSDAPQAGDRFQREIKVLQSLPASPHVVGYVDEGELPDGRPFVALELIDGYPLSRLMTPGKRINPKQACTLILQLCDAFAGLHRLGLTHGDIKPQNVMITGGGTAAKLLDFGLVRDAQGLLGVLQREGLETGSEFVEDIDGGMLMGTPEYMAPEQISDARVRDWSERKTDTPADVFGLGVILYELLAGRRPFPFSARSARTWRTDARQYLQARLEAADDVLEPIDDVPAALMSIIDKALKHNPRHRQGNAALLAIDVRLWLTEGRGVEDEADDTIATFDRAGLDDLHARWLANAAAADADDSEAGTDDVTVEADQPPPSDPSDAVPGSPEPVPESPPPPIPSAAHRVVIGPAAMPAEPTRDDRTGAGQQSLLEQAARSDRWRSVLLGAFTVGALCGAAALWMLGS